MGKSSCREDLTIVAGDNGVTEQTGIRSDCPTKGQEPARNPESLPVTEGLLMANGLAANGATSSLTGRFRRGVLIIVGILSVLTGVVGVVVPILPTTPFLLLAAACFLRGSTSLHDKLMNHRLLGTFIRRYRSGAGMPARMKVQILLFLWSGLLVSGFFVAGPYRWWLRLLLLAVGVGVSVHIVIVGRRRLRP